jgi:hypothetical protein
VAHHPILSQEITNGHAARMRYSRFKKQMDGTATVRRPRGPNSPRKKVEKNKSPRKGKSKANKGEEDDDEAEKIKLEPGSRQGTVESDAGSERHERKVKLEPGLGVASSSESQPTPRTMPGTPSSRYVREASASPSPGPSEWFDRAGDMSEMDEMGVSFGMPGEEAGMASMYAPMMGEGVGGGFGMGMGMQMGLGDPFGGHWQGGHGGQGGGGIQVGEGGVLVKTEPRWEDAYRHV